MNSDLLEKLEKKGNINLKVKPIFYKGNERFLLDSFLKNQKYLKSDEILEILKINFTNDHLVGYALLRNDKDMVGFLGTIFSNRPIKEKILEHCYLHSWIVNEKYRFEAFKLIIPILKKNIFISTYFPIKSLEGLYKKFGFEEVQFISKFAFLLPSLRLKRDNLKFSEDHSLFEKYLKKNDRIFLKDHLITDTKKIFFYLDKNLHNNIFIIVKKKIKKKIFPILEIIYISDLAKFKIYEANIAFELFKKFKTLFFKYNNFDKDKIFSNNFLILRNIKKKAFYYNLPSNFKFDVLYSELVR